MIGAFGATPRAPLAGVTDVTLKGGGTVLVVDVDADVDVDVVVDPPGGCRPSPVEEEELRRRFVPPRHRSALRRRTRG